MFLPRRTKATPADVPSIQTVSGAGKILKVTLSGV